MQTKLNEPLLAQCSLRYTNGEADKLHECYITPTKLYFHRKGTVEVTALQNISNVKSTQEINWILLLIGVAIIGLALINYSFDLYPAKDPRLTYQPSSPDELLPLEYILTPAQRMELQLDWEESRNLTSFYIALAGGVFVYFGLKKKAYLRIILNNRQVIHLRVFTITDEYEKFYHTLLSRVGLTPIVS